MKWLLTALFIPLCWGQTANSYQFDPPTVPAGAASVILYIPIAGAATRVTLDPAWASGTDLDLRDDGVSPDKVAGDRIFSINVPLAKLIMTPDDVFRPFLGFLKVWTGTTVAVRYNMFLPVAALDIPRMPIVEDSSTMRHTAYVVNILAPEAFPASTSATLGSFSSATQKFYQRFGDDYDVLNIVWASPSFFQNRDHSIVKNTTRGIGLAQSDNSAAYSSKGTLAGVTRFPSVAFLDGAEAGNQHEFGHQWISYLTFAPLASGVPHWADLYHGQRHHGFFDPPRMKAAIVLAFGPRTAAASS